MRLTTLTLENYGIFQSEHIDFDPTPGRINLLIAPNGAGKSILRNAFCDLLFGIHGQTPMGFRYGYGRMRLMAEARGRGGETLSFARRKGQGNTLIDADGATLDPAVLAAFLGQTDRTLVERLFALDTERLREGGRELLASNGSLADALLSAAGGMRHARHLQQSLLAARDALAPLRRAQARPFYQELDRLTQARQQLANAVLKPETREKQQIELAHLQAEQEQCNKQAAAASQRIARLERIRRVVGVLADHDAATAWLAAHPDAPDLPADIGERLGQAQEAVLRAEQLLEQARRTREPLAEQLEHLHVDVALIAQGEAVDRLVERAAVARQALLDIPKREAELARSSDDIGAILRQLGSALPVARAAEAVPPRGVVVQARRLATEHAKLRVTLAALPAELAQSNKDIVATEADLAVLPPVADHRGLARLLREIRGAGDPDHRAREAAQATEDRRAKLGTALARTRHWRQGAAELVALPVLPVETYERLQAACTAADAALTASERELADCRTEIEAEQQRLADIVRDQPIPDEAAIAAVRRHRDIGWQLIYRRAFTGDPPDAAQEAAWAREQSLPLGFERSITAADDLADRRNREGERLVQATELTRRIGGLTARLAATETKRTAAQAQRDAAREAWRDACTALALPDDAAIAELRAFLAGRERVIDADEAFAAASRDQAALEERHAAWAGRLAAELGRTAASATTLTELLGLAEECLEANKHAEDMRARLQDRLATQRKNRDEKADRRHSAETALAMLMQEWAQVRQALQRPDGEDPATTIELLELLNLLDHEHQAATKLGHRLREMQEEIAGFRTQAAELAARLTPELTDSDAFAVAQALRQRLGEQRELARQHETVAAALKRADAALARHQKQHDDSHVELRTVLAVIAADSVEVAQARVALAAERARMADTLRRSEAELHAKGDGHSVTELRREVEAVAMDDIVGAIGLAQRDRDAANADAQSLAARVATMQAEMAQQAAADSATRAAAEQQSAIAALRRVTEEAALMHLAALLLDASLTQVEIAGTSVLLARIADLFRTITGGTYTRIEVEEQSDGSAGLIAVQAAFPDERKAVKDLSEGERDQLFLALRLAAIEDHVATAPPLPFVCDDILQTFDDDRATAAMQALVQLSENVQVILLSHHRHLLALAQRLPAESVAVCRMTAAVAA